MLANANSAMLSLHLPSTRGSTMKRQRLALLLLPMTLACEDDNLPSHDQELEATEAVEWREAQESDFTCLSEMSSVRGFYVSNYLGDIDGTIEAAITPGALSFPVGSIVQLVPQEAMVKLPEGSSPETLDWQYLIIDNETGGNADYSARWRRGRKPSRLMPQLSCSGQRERANL